MAETIHDVMGAVLTRWTMGAAAASAAPVWQAELGTDPAEAELRLLALSGQFLGVAVTAEPPVELRTLPDIPALALPTLPDPLRPLFRRLLTTLRDNASRHEVLNFLVERGRTAHPDDWMPAAGDDEAPDAYAPWRDWVEAAASAEPSRERPADALTVENWDDFWPAMRKLELADLRREDPAAARALMAAKFPSCGADERLRLLRLLAVGLSPDDQEFLEQLATGDRAPKVKAQASAFLGRLGRKIDGGADAKELADFFQMKTKGFLRRGKAILAKPTKNYAQVNRRRTLMGEAELAGFAASLNQEPDDLVTVWGWHEDERADLDFAEMIERSGSDAQINALVALLLQQPQAALRIAAVLRPRLTPVQRMRFAHRGLAEGEPFTIAVHLGGGIGRIDKPIDTAAGNLLIAALTAAESGGAAAQSGELHALGLVASRAGAIDALERLSRAGLLTADPRLDMLRLNAALDDKGVTE